MIPGKDFMANKQCCRTCGHCTSLQSGLDYWCRLRKILVPAEISQIAFCHHWTKKSPSLPTVHEKTKDYSMDHQLEIGRTLLVTDR